MSSEETDVDLPVAAYLRNFRKDETSVVTNPYIPPKDKKNDDMIKQVPLVEKSDAEEAIQEARQQERQEIIDIVKFEQQARELEDLARRMEAGQTRPVNRESMLELVQELYDKADEIAELEEEVDQS